MHYWQWQDIELRHFRPAEFDHPELMDADFLLTVDEWRARHQHPFGITGDGRTDQEHRNIYAPDPAPVSAHPEGLAIDGQPVHDTGEARWDLLLTAWEMHEEGLWLHLGVEVATRHFHLENFDHPRFDRPTVWGGVSK